MHESPRFIMRWGLLCFKFIDVFKRIISAVSKIEDIVKNSYTLRRWSDSRWLYCLSTVPPTNASARWRFPKPSMNCDRLTPGTNRSLPEWNKSSGPARCGTAVFACDQSNEDHFQRCISRAHQQAKNAADNPSQDVVSWFWKNLLFPVAFAGKTVVYGWSRKGGMNRMDDERIIELFFRKRSIIPRL